MVVANESVSCSFKNLAISTGTLFWSGFSKITDGSFYWSVNRLFATYSYR